MKVYINQNETEGPEGITVKEWLDRQQIAVAVNSAYSAAQQARTFSRFFHRILLSCMFFPQRDKLPAKPKSEEVRNRDY